VKLRSSLLPYLLLVSFSTGQISDFSVEKMKAVDASPYDGVAVALTTPYDTDRHAEEEVDRAIGLIRKNTEKQVWPWVYVNRIVGSSEDGQPLYATAGEKPEFRRIKGLDLENEAGALEDFYTLWRIALATARKLGSPGIVVDHEAYNNYRGYNVAYVARKQGIPEGDVIARLKAIGAKLADLTEAEYPGAIVWFLSTGLVNGDQSGSYPLRTVTYIAIGMLERARAVHARLKLVSGGESSLGYCHLSANELRETIRLRDSKYEGFLSEYPNLALGGTIAPWADASARTEWMLKDKCGRSPLRTAADFGPLYRELFGSYRYVWVYAAKVAPYNPYDAAVAAAYNNALRDALH
jgi:hypothetical protein